MIYGEKNNFKTEQLVIANLNDENCLNRESEYYKELLGLTIK